MSAINHRQEENADAEYIDQVDLLVVSALALALAAGISPGIRTLYMTARTGLYRMRLEVPHIRPVPTQAS